MSVKRIAVRDIWFEGTLSEIQRALEDSPDGEERRRRMDKLCASVQSKPPGVEEVVRAAVEHAVREALITEDEGKRLIEQV